MVNDFFAHVVRHLPVSVVASTAVVERVCCLRPLTVAFGCNVLRHRCQVGPFAKHPGPFGFKKQHIGKGCKPFVVFAAQGNRTKPAALPEHFKTHQQMPDYVAGFAVRNRHRNNRNGIDLVNG